MKKNNRDEANAWLVVRIILLIIALVFIGYGIIWKPECDSDQTFLACRLTGSIFDIIGSILFLGGLVWVSGIIKGISNLYNPPGSGMWNYIWFVLMLAGIMLFWFL
jgi:hypothetical protein